MPPQQLSHPDGEDGKLRLAKLRHELRTPINHIIGYSEMLLEEAQGQMPDSFLSDLRKIRGGGEQLLALIHEHLGDERARAARPDLHRVCHELRTPVNHVIGYSELLMDQCAELGQPGFQPDLAKINSAAKKWLALMEEQLMGATPRERAPAPGEDTVVFTRLEQKIAAPLPSDKAVLNPQQGRLLLADDDLPNRELLRRRLEKLGYQVTACGDGRQALKRLQAETFDLALLDLLMPEMNGAEVLARLKADPALRHLPVIMISALDQMDSIVRCIELGAEDYIGKPFDAVFLRARIGAALEKKRLRDWEQIYLKQIEEERAKSERLLLNVLPRAIADRLKQGEGMVADHFAEVTVVFADLVGFTVLAAELPPPLVVRLLNDIFSAFDDLATEHGLEKIKTIGDAYMAVAGLPTPRADHAVVATRLALDMLAALQRFNQERQTALEMRIGLNTGPVIAGIIGRRKFAYDLWGDTVNTASRMESHGEPGTVQVSQATAEKLRDHFELKPRGDVVIKGKGRLPTWLVLGPKEG
jgi:class 3 adenylate cyclase/CheY-like chemotaxis protein